jgi:hypothetical protein
MGSYVEEEINEMIVQMENRGWEFYRDDSRSGVFFRMMKARREREGVSFCERNFYHWDYVAQYIKENKPLDEE